MNLRQLRFSHRSITIAAALVGVVSLAIGAHAALNMRALDAAKAVATALQKYGMFLDDGGNIPLTFDASAAAYLGSHDLFGINVSDFEIVASPDPAVTLTDNCTRTPVTN